MRKLALVLALVFLASAVSFADDVRDITVVNKAGEPITELYITLANDKEWGPDVLGVDVLENGQSAEITFSGFAKKDCLFDILARNKDGDEWQLEDVNLCQVEKVTITSGNIKAK